MASMPHTPIQERSEAFRNNLNFLLKNFARAHKLGWSAEEEWVSAAEALSTDHVQVLCTRRLTLPHTSPTNHDIGHTLMIKDKSQLIVLERGDNKSGLLIDSSDTSPGYVQLLQVSSNSKHPSNYSVEDFKKDSVSLEYVEKVDEVLHGEAYHDRGSLVVEVGVSCPHWPHQAQSWLHRERHYGWPHADTLHAVIQDGCLLLPQANVTSQCPDVEWRLSFSQAEGRLTETLSDTQKQCLLLLLMLYQQEIEPLGTLHSHHLVTCMLWMCEDSPEASWTEEALGECFILTLQWLIHALQNKTLPNFFIPENNLLEHLTDQQVNCVLSQLCEVTCQPWVWIRALQERYPEPPSWSYDVTQIVLDTMGLKPCQTRNYFKKQPGILNQIFDQVLEDLESEHYDGRSHLVCATRLACGLVVGDGELAALKVYLDMVDLMEELGHIPNDWAPQHDAVFISTMVRHIITKVPNYLRAFCRDCAVAFLDQVRLTTNIIDPERDHTFLATIIEMCCVEPGADLYSDIIHDCLQHLKKTQSISGKLLNILYLRKQGNEANAIHDLQKEIITKPNSMINLRSSTELVASQSDLDDIKRYNVTLLANAVECIVGDLQSASDDVVLYADMTILDQMLFLACKHSTATVSFSLGFMLAYLSATSHRQDDNSMKESTEEIVQISQSSQDPNQTMLCGFFMYKHKRFKEALDLFEKQLKPDTFNIYTKLLSLVCRLNLDKENQAHHEHQSPNTEIQAHHEHQPPNTENNADCGPCGKKGRKPGSTQSSTSETESTLANRSNCEEVHVQLDPIECTVMDTMNLIHPKDLVSLQKCLQNRPQELPDFCLADVHACAGKHLHLHSLTTEDQDEKSQLLAVTKRSFRNAVLCPEADLRHRGYYLNFLWKEQMLPELTANVQELNSTLGTAISADRTTMTFFETEIGLLPDFLHLPLQMIPQIQLPSALYIKYIESCLYNATNPFQARDMVYDLTADFSGEHEQYMKDIAQSPYWIRSLTQSIMFETLGHTLFLLRKYESARAMFVEGVRCFPGEHKGGLENIHRCEDRLMRQAMLYMLEEKFTSAYQTYTQVWNTCLPRCTEDCSLLLHLSEEVLSLSKEDDRALRLGVMYLQHALLEDAQSGSPSDGSHRSHALAILGCLYFWMYQTAAEEEDRTDYADSCEKCLRQAADLSAAGSAHSLLSNYFVMQEKYHDASECLPEAIRRGKSEQLPTQPYPHHLCSKTSMYRMEHNLPVDPLFKLLVCSQEDHFQSYLIYSLYLQIIVDLAINRDPSSDILELVKVSNSTSHCPGKYALLGLVYLLTADYDTAASHFEQELSEQPRDLYLKHKLLHQLKALCKCSTILAVQDETAAGRLVQEWLHVLKTTRSVIVTLPEHGLMTHHLTEDISLALFMTTQLPQALSIQDPRAMQCMSDIYDLLHTELQGIDPMADGISTNMALLLSERHHAMNEGPVKDALAEEVTKAFMDALSQPQTFLSTTRLAFASFLLSQQKLPEAAEQSTLAVDIAMEHVCEILKRGIEESDDLSNEEEHMLSFYLEKSLIPATDHLVICFVLMGEFSRAFEAVDVLLATLHRAQQLDVDPLAYLIKYTLELPRFGASISTVIEFHEAVIARYPHSRYVPTIHNNLGCMLFALARQQCGGQTEELLEKARDSFQEAVSYEGITMAPYADFANFLHNTDQQEAALTLICESDDLSDSAQGSNAYGVEEKPCVDECIRGIIEASGKFLIDSHVYIQYLRVAVLIALNKDPALVHSELTLLEDMGQQKQVNFTQRLSDFLRAKMAKELST